MKITFDVPEPYYLPHYLPVIDELRQRGYDPECLFYRGRDDDLNRYLIDQNELDAVWLDSSDAMCLALVSAEPDWLVVGDQGGWEGCVPRHTRTALLPSGIGPGESYYRLSATAGCSVRFVEEPSRHQVLKSRFPGQVFVESGLAKLDPVVTGDPVSLTADQLGFDPDKLTLLYAPSHCDSSLDAMPLSLPEELQAYNVIIKPHYRTLTDPALHRQRAKLDRWKQYPHVHIPDVHQVSLVPYFSMADVLISEATSPLFEFAATGKPVIWMDFPRWRLSRAFRRRLPEADLALLRELAMRAGSYAEFLRLVTATKKSEGGRRATEARFGCLDGHSSERVVEYLLAN